jgi:hypothetical protein
MGTLYAVGGGILVLLGMVAAAFIVAIPSLP